MKKIKTTIIILLVITLIVFICILILKDKMLQDENIPTLSDRTQDFINEMDIVSDYDIFFSIEKMIDKYLLKVASEDKEAAYSILDSEYKNKNNITKDNVLEKIPEIVKKSNNLIVRKMYGQTNMENAVYYTYCILEKDKIGDECYFALYKDTKNLTYSIAHIDKETFEREINYAKENLERKTIKENEYNLIVNEYSEEQERANRYFKNFIENAVYDAEYTYGLLDEEYKKERFPTIKDFEEYIASKEELYTAATTNKTHTDFDNMEDYVLYITKKQRLQLKGYQIRYEEDYTRYICIDSFNNYYVFYATSPLNYTVMLDTYTIDVQDFIDKYEAGTNEEKVGYNIQKIVEALNSSDYKYIYSKLSEDFKANYFGNYDEFEKYAKETFSIKNEVTYNKYTESENLSTYQITIKGQTKTVTKTIVMRLEEGTDFVFAFNVE